MNLFRKAFGPKPANPARPTHVAGVEIPTQIQPHFHSGQVIPQDHPAREAAAKFVTQVWRNNEAEGRRMSEKLLGIGEGGKHLSPNVKPSYATIKDEMPTKKLEPGGVSDSGGGRVPAPPTQAEDPLKDKGRQIRNTLSGGLPEKTGWANLTQEVGNLFGKTEKYFLDLAKSKNVREQRKKVFGGWKTTAGSPKREKQMRTLRDYAEKRFGAKVRRAEGKKSAAGKMIDKPDLTTGYIEHIGNPDSLAHELAHLDLAPENVAMKQFQQKMDEEWGAQNVKFGYKQQARVKDEYESTARENQIRRALGMPAHAKGRMNSAQAKPKDAFAADRPEVRVARKLPSGKYIAAGSEVITPESKALLESRESSNAKYDPKTGWRTEPSVHSAINLRGKGQFDEAKKQAERYLKGRKKSNLGKSEDLEKNQTIHNILNNGMYALITPHRSDAKSDENDRSHQGFVSDLKNMGYNPIAATGRWGGSVEPSYLVPNMTREHAVQLGKKYGQMAVIHGAGGEHEEIATDGSYTPMGKGRGYSEVGAGEDHTEIKNPDGTSFRFKLHFGHEPMKKNSPQLLEHYSAKRGLKEITPHHMGTGAPSAEYKRGLPEIARAYYYLSGTKPESIVHNGAASKYKVALPEGVKLYDLAKDTDGHVRQAIADNGGAWNSDKILGRIKDAGYHGYTNSGSPLPNVVAMFHPLKVHSEESA